MTLLPDEAATIAAGEAVGQRLRIGDVILLSGELGAGKTCFARGILQGLGFGGDVPSPSFPLVIPYGPPDVALPLWHVDLYRIDDPDEVEGLALYEALCDGALVIEWPERLGEQGWPGALAIRLEQGGESGRRLTAQVPPSWETRWPFP